MAFNRHGQSHRGGRSADHDFSMVPRADIPRSTFMRNFTHKTTFDGGLLIPIFVDEVLPGDTFKVQCHAFARLATPIVPVMDNLYCDIFFFYVPNRLLWTHWVNFNGEQTNPGDSVSYTVPLIDCPSGGFAALSIYDYMGIPVGLAYTLNSFAIVALPFRAYNLIWHQWFRDENLQNAPQIDTGDGPDNVSDYVLLNRGKRHDYFTSCLPWPVKGNQVQLGLAGTAVVKTSSTPTWLPASGTGLQWLRADTGAAPANSVLLGIDASGNSNTAYGTNALTGQVADLLPRNLYADLTTATSTTINSLRQAFQIQKMLERDARGGTRYVEILKSHFGVTSPDFRLQRAEFLGGGSAPITIHPVVQTSTVSGTTTPKGDLGAFGTMGHSTAGFHKSFVEHGYILGLAHVRADLSYQNGLARMWSRQARTDFYWPALAHIGEQAVLNQEIYLQGVAATDQAVFGYQERWAEYRYYPSMITGQFRSKNPTPLDIWHLAQNFTALPVLGASFIQDNPPLSRISSVSSEPHIMFDSFFEMKCTRPMPMYSVPGLIDHF